MGRSKGGAGGGTGGTCSFEKCAPDECEVDEVRVETDDDREKLKLGLLESERSDSFDMRVTDCFRARASIEVFLV